MHNESTSFPTAAEIEAANETPGIAAEFVELLAHHLSGVDTVDAETAWLLHRFPDFVRLESQLMIEAADEIDGSLIDACQLIDGRE